MIPSVVGSQCSNNVALYLSASNACRIRTLGSPRCWTSIWKHCTMTVSWKKETEGPKMLGIRDDYITNCFDCLLVHKVLDIYIGFHDTVAFSWRRPSTLTTLACATCARHGVYFQDWCVQEEDDGWLKLLDIYLRPTAQRPSSGGSRTQNGLTFAHTTC